MILLLVIVGLLGIAILFARWFLFFKGSNSGNFEKSLWLLSTQAADNAFAAFTHEESGVEFRFTKRFGNGQSGVVLAVRQIGLGKKLDEFESVVEHHGLATEPKLLDGNIVELELGASIETAAAVAREIASRIFGFSRSTKYRFTYGGFGSKLAVNQ